MKKRILVVDDDPAVTLLVKLNLEQTGRYEVRKLQPVTNHCCAHKIPAVKA